MSDDLKVSVTVRGLRDPAAAERCITALLKRSLYLVDGEPGEFGARIEGPSGAIELDEDREWRRAEGTISTAEAAHSLAGRPRPRLVRSP